MVPILLSLHHAAVGKVCALPAETKTAHIAVTENSLVPRLLLKTVPDGVPSIACLCVSNPPRRWGAVLEPRSGQQTDNRSYRCAWCGSKRDSSCTESGKLRDVDEGWGALESSESELPSRRRRGEVVARDCWYVCL